MRVDAGMDARLPLADVAGWARRVEALGFDGLNVPETIHDGFATALLALEHTERLHVRTAVTLAFVRSPMLTAYSAWDLSRLSGGRFDLGLGTQIRQNVEDRYGMPWSEPVARMRDYVGAVRAALTAFSQGSGIAYDGEVYRLTRLQPMFNPGPDIETRIPELWLGGVGPAMTCLAGEVADGYLTHPTASTPHVVAQLSLPALVEGAARRIAPPHPASGREHADVVVAPAIATGRDEEAVLVSRERQRRVLAFLYSTPAYGRSLVVHGFDGLGDDLRRLIREQRWDSLGAVVTDEMLDALVISATYDTLAARLHAAYDGLVTGVSLIPPADPADDEAWADVVADLRGR